MLKDNPNFYHTLHEQVMLSLDEKALDEKEADIEINVLRKKLVEQAEGIVLETCIGTNRNLNYYKMQKIRKIIGVDWVN